MLRFSSMEKAHCTHSTLWLPCKISPLTRLGLSLEILEYLMQEHTVFSPWSSLWFYSLCLKCAHGVLLLLWKSGAANATHTIVIPCASPTIGAITDWSASRIVKRHTDWSAQIYGINDGFAPMPSGGHQCYDRPCAVIGQVSWGESMWCFSTPSHDRPMHNARTIVLHSQLSCSFHKWKKCVIYIYVYICIYIYA